jgi:hypothetical protein
MSEYGILPLPDTVLVLEPRNSGKVGYYFADHRRQVVFWLDECDLVWNLKEVKVEFSLSHVGEYLRTWESFILFIKNPLNLGHLVRSYYW